MQYRNIADMLIFIYERGGKVAKEYNITIVGHPSIYDEKERKLNIYFCEPEQQLIQMFIRK
ncbi:hypothetical protein CLTEP_12810 [Clostridium tepidiprofundi DSM 19306]|uniref:Uncharacterized protein n=1 Tax=Clostridium tepidiprofundi DSM 19306 TaxID=1121338 RepID=A0A151B4K0_9CLOT|nr:hypothetical protein CLTEP_12810 [Clostridium tepidiprofundi DSM 19306]